MGNPGGRREGPPDRDSSGVACQGADVAGFPGGGGGAPHHGREGQQLAPPSPAQRPHPVALPPAEPTNAAVPAPTQAAAQVTAAPGGDDSRRWARGGGEGPVTRDTPPAGPGPPTQSAPLIPPPYGAAEGRAPPPVGERAVVTSARMRVARETHCATDRQPLTTDPRPPPQRHHAVRRRQREGRGAPGRGPAQRPSARRMEASTRGVRPPPSTAGPPGPGPPGRPLAAAGERHQGKERDYGEPPPSLSPPDPRTAGGRPAGRRPRTPPAGPGGGPPPGRAGTPREGRHCRGKRCCTPHASSQPPTLSYSARGRPAALRRRAGAPRGAQRDGGTRT